MNERLRDFAVPFAGAGMVLALAGCSQTYNGSLKQDQYEVVSVSDGFIYQDVNVRHDPAVVDNENDGGTNACLSSHDSKTAIVFSAGPAFESADNSDMGGNGDWIGFKLDRMPRNIALKCSGDKDGIVWVSKQYVDANVEPVQAVDASVAH